MNPLNLLWLLLPVAAFSGWWLARRGMGAAESRVSSTGLRSDYFKGINYLLDEQPDKAIDVFIKVLEVDSETVDTHLALGNLYRRRGEVDRAIRIHQNLIARPNLSDDERKESLLELGRDYLTAGLLDRAENLFRELSGSDNYQSQALRQLMDIYEQEKDWEKAIGAAHRLEDLTGNAFSGVIAHYHCEKAEGAENEGDLDAAVNAARQALAVHGSCVRASLLEGDLLYDRGDHRDAVEAYRRVEEQDPGLVSETIKRIAKCYDALGQPEEMSNYLSEVLQRFGGVTATLALADIKNEEEGASQAIEFIAEQLRRHSSVRGLDRMLQLELQAGGDAVSEHLRILKDVTTELLEDRPAYKCSHCGFPAKSLHWKCPGCKHWDTIKPIKGVEGE